MDTGKSQALLNHQGTSLLEVPEKAVYMIFLTIFIDILAATISTPVMPFYAQTFGASTQQIGYLFAAWSFCSTFFAPVLGRWSDAYGRKPILVLALVGAGVANLLQGLSYYSIQYFGQNIAFYIFGFCRAFSGVWAAIGTVTNVYLADVVPKALLPEYMAKQSIVGPLAFTFGPSLGGGLATIGGNNFPVMVDGLITLLSAFIVATNLPESPAFLRLKKEREDSKGNVPGSAGGGIEVPKTPWQVWVLCAAAFFGGLTMSAMVSMQALFLSEVYKFDVLHVTFVSVGSAVTLILTGMFVSTPVKNCLGVKRTIVVCNTIGGFLYMFSAYCGEYHLSIWFFLASTWLNSMQSSVAGACTGPLLQGFCEVSNRGKINSTNQLWMNFGRMVGPLMYGRIATSDISKVWIVAGAALIVKAALTCFIETPSEKKPTLQRKGTLYGDAWQDEVGSVEDERQIGKFVGDLLTKNHYKWISRRSEIESLIQHVLPELSIESKDMYDQQLHELEMSAHVLHATTK